MMYTCNINSFFSEKKERNKNIYIVAALDILGFSNFILNNYDNEKIEKVNYLLKLMSIFQDKKDYQAVLFSDCIFLFLKIDYRETILSEFSSMLYDIEKVIEIAMQNGFLIRGGICVGECHVDIQNNIFYGPGIIKAHILEEKIAISARIIMEHEDYNQLKDLFIYVKSLNATLIKHEFCFIQTDDYYCFDFIEAMFNYTGFNTDMTKCMERYKYCLNICRDVILNTGGHDKEKHLSKLSFHEHSYSRILSQYKPEYIPTQIKNLYE